MELTLLMPQCAGTQLDSSITLARYVETVCLPSVPFLGDSAAVSRDGTGRDEDIRGTAYLLTFAGPYFARDFFVPSHPD